MGWAFAPRANRFSRIPIAAYLLTTSKVTPCFGILDVNTPDRRPKSVCFQTSRTLPPLLNPISLRSTDTSRVLQLRLKSPTATRPPLSLIDRNGLRIHQNIFVRIRHLRQVIPR